MSTTAIIKPMKMQRIEAEHGVSFDALDSRLVAEGWSDGRIADHLGISTTTLYSYREILGMRPKTTRQLVPTVG